MEENTNSSLFINSIILYIRLGIVTICTLFSTRFALQALGIVDFGLFSVVGSVISFVAIINTMMVSTSNRFIATAIGKGDVKLANKQFNVNLFVHIGIAIITLIIAYPVGDWYILNFVNYDGDINNAVYIYNITIISSVFAFLGVPYNGLLLAKERFAVFCSTDIISNIIKLIVSWLLLYHFNDKLMTYAYMMVITTAYPTIVFFIYCSINFRDIVRFHFIKEWKSYYEVLKFTIWVGYGTIVQVGKTQCAALLVNGFFSTIMNSALGISNSIKNLVETFYSNVTKPIEPQITKSFAAGNDTRCYHLMILSAKLAFIFSLIFAVPLFLETEFFIQLWLGSIPEGSILFTRILLGICLVDSLSCGLAEYVFARGDLRSYQFWVNTILLLSIPTAYFVLRSGACAEALLYTYLSFSIIVFFCKQIIIKKRYNFKISILIKQAYLPALFLVIISTPLLFMHRHIQMHSFIRICIDFIYIIICAFFISLSKEERNTISQLIKHKFFTSKI